MTREQAAVKSAEFKSGTFGGVDLAGHAMSEAVNHLRPEVSPAVQGEPIFDGAAFIWRTPCGWTVTAYAEAGSDEFAIGWASPSNGPVFSIEPNGTREYAGEWQPANQQAAQAA